jgi:hypothetical protein
MLVRIVFNEKATKTTVMCKLIKHYHFVIKFHLK